jgi:sugar/nucleoside kinase (ribokinase family)
VAKVDVLGIGCATIDDIIYIYGLPPVDGKARVVSKARDFGGLTATALVAAARLGASCSYAGMLGNDPDSVAVIHDLRRSGVVVSRQLLCRDARPIRSTIITSLDQGTRSIYFDTPPVTGAPPSIPERTIRNARVLLLDGYGLDGCLRATKVALSANIPVVADFELDDEKGFPQLLELVDHLILSAHFALHITGTSSITASLRALWNEGRKLVAVTDGSNGCWVTTDHARDVLHVPAYPVTPVDTTGCGDVFHGAYAAALAFGYPALGAIRFASVVAALKATHLGTRQAIPSRADVEARLPAAEFHAPVRPR